MTANNERPGATAGSVTHSGPAAPGDSIPQRAASATPGGSPGFLSEAACRDIVQRLARYTTGGGYTAATIWSATSGHVRWARNQISTAGEVSMTYIRLNRDLQGANHGDVFLNETSDAALVAAARRAERLAKLEPGQPQWELLSWFPLEPMTHPQLFSAATATLDAEHRAEAAVALAKNAAESGVLSAGFIEAAVHSLAMVDSLGHVSYCPYTTASYSVTVRDPKGTGSGWAGVDWPDWSRIDAPKLSQVALEKCLQSRNPVAIEPGRYTTILEPQAVCDFVGQLMYDGFAPDPWSEAGSIGTTGNSMDYPFFKQYPDKDSPGLSRLGERVVDERITISADPMDSELGFPPFVPSAQPLGVNFVKDWWARDVFRPTAWIKDGVLTALAYQRDPFGGKDIGDHYASGNPNSGAFRMSGGTTSVDEMIATTKRGLLVTRFDQMQGLQAASLLLRGYTRDGLWLIENGKISKPCKNMMFVESILFALNNVEQLGVPQRAYHPATGRLAIPQPAIVPPLKVRDFSFTALADAI